MALNFCKFKILGKTVEALIRWISLFLFYDKYNWRINNNETASRSSSRSSSITSSGTYTSIPSISSKSNNVSNTAKFFPTNKVFFQTYIFSFLYVS